MDAFATQITQRFQAAIIKYSRLWICPCTAFPNVLQTPPLLITNVSVILGTSPSFQMCYLSQCQWNATATQPFLSKPPFTSTHLQNRHVVFLTQ